jgi:hypothetical protein
MNLKVMAAIGGVLLVSTALGCDEPAVTDDKPNGVVNGGFGGVAGMAGTGGIAAGTGGVSGAIAGVGGAAGAGGMSGEGGIVAGIGGAAGGGEGGMGGEGGAAGGGEGGMGGEGGAAGGGIGGIAGGGMGGEGGAAGDDGPPGPCPAGWTCEDTSWTGAIDEAGNPIAGTSCGKGGLIPCDSCPELTKPICATVFDTQSCTQLCTP